MKCYATWTPRFKFLQNRSFFSSAISEDASMYFFTMHFLAVGPHQGVLPLLVLTAGSTHER